MTERRTFATHWSARALAATLALCVPLTATVPNSALAASAASKEAAVVAKQALQYYQSGKWDIAAELYRRAYRIDPTRPEYLFGVGRAEQRAGRYREALLAFETLLTILPEGEPFRTKVETAVAETKAEQAKAKADADAKSKADAAAKAKADADAKSKSDAEAKAKSDADAKAAAKADADAKAKADADAKAKPVVVAGADKTTVVVTVEDPRKSPPPPSETNWLGWGLVAGGGALAFTGLGLGIGVLSDGSDWVELVGRKDASGQIVGTDYQTAASMADDLNQRAVLALGIGFAGVAAAGVGTWLLVRKSQRVAVVPTGDGVLFSAAF